MNDCKTFSEKMMTAPLEELDPGGEGPLAGHLRGCPSCAARAASLVAATRSLARHLDDGRSLPDVEGLIALARATGAPAPDSGPGIRRRSRSLPWLGLAAAAVLAAVLLPPSPPLPPDPAGLDRTGSPPLVEPAPGQDVAVLPTRNPDLTIVWIF